MRTSTMPMLELLLLSLAGASASAASQADNCEPIRAQIDARIRAGGVTRFTLSTVDAKATAAGKVVGSCDLGTKKILYIAGDTSASASAPASSAPARKPATVTRDEPIWTECKDGTVSRGGDCKK